MRPLDTQVHLPHLIVHADWSTSYTKRWMARAELGQGGRYQAKFPELVRDARSLLPHLRGQVGFQGVILLGFDFPIGLPLAYAERCGVTDFLSVLPRLGEGEWSEFYHVAETPEQISLSRPFYPSKAGSARQSHLLQALGLTTINELRRQCELAHPGRRAAAPIFWTLGGQQVGKAAIAGWQEVLGPAMKASASQATQLQIAIWPFSGRLCSLLQPGCTVVAETYPAEFYAHLGVRFSNPRRRSVDIAKGPNAGKRSRVDRRANAQALLDWAQRADVSLSSDLVEAIRDGFGPKLFGEDQFDAVVGLFGMLNIVLGLREAGDPLEEDLCKVEGWILGQAH